MYRPLIQKAAVQRELPLTAAPAAHVRGRIADIQEESVLPA
jgi:hypothetical protein